MRKYHGHDHCHSLIVPASPRACGGDVIYFEDGPPNAGASFIRKPEDIKRLTPPRVDSAACLKKVLAATKMLKEKVADAPVVGVVLSPFSVPVMQMGFDKYIELMYEQPELFWHLMRLNEEFCVNWANAQLAAGADMIAYFDPVSSSTITQKELYLKTGCVIAKRTLSQIKGPVAIHMASGRCLPVLHEIAASGAKVVVTSVLEDLAEVKAVCKKKIAVMGNLNTIEMHRWTPRQAEVAVKDAIYKACPGGGYILSDNQSEIPVQVPDEVLLALSEAVSSCNGKYNRVHVFVGFNSTALQGMSGALEHCCFHRQDCSYLLAGKDVIDRYLKEGAHLLVPGQVKHWRRYIEASGFDQKTAQEFFGESTRRLLLLDTGADAKSSDYLKEFAGFVKLPFEIAPVGIDYFRLLLTKHILEWRTNILRQEASALAKKNADYATSLDLVAGITQKTNESDVIRFTFDLFSMVFASQRMFYLPIKDGAPGSLVSKTNGDFDVKETTNHLLGLQEDYAWTKSNNGFTIRIKHPNEVVGVVEATEFVHPEHKNEYLNLALLFAEICGLMITNVRRYELLKELNKTLEQRVSNRVKELEEVKEQLYHAQKMETVGRLAGNVAHDFNNKLMAIMGYANLLEMQLKEGDPAIALIKKQLESIGKARTITQSLLAFSRKQPVNFAPVSLNKIIEDLREFLPGIARETVVCRLDVNAGDSLVMADAGRLEQVLMNITKNAVDAMPNGGRLTISVGVVYLDYAAAKGYGLGKAGPHCSIAISDTGTGMSKETRERIFEPFFTTKERGKGTGLGLPVAYGIVKQHNGHIAVFSEVNKGTTFTIYLPLTEKTMEEMAAKPITVTAAKPPAGGETILVAEDEDAVRDVLTRMLERQGYKTIVATDGEDAVAKFKENKDIIRMLVFDVMMPNKNGKEAFDAIKEIKPDSKVLFLSGYSEDVDSNSAILRDGLHFIQKPVNPDILLKKVREIMGA